MSDGYLSRIEDFAQQSSEFLGIFDANLKRLHTLRPFGASGIKIARPIGPRIFLCAHLNAKPQAGTPLAVINAQTGQEIARASSFVLPDKLINLPQNRMIAVVGSLAEVEFRDAETLDLIWTCRPRMVRLPSGKFAAVDNDLLPSQAPREAIKPRTILAEAPGGVLRMPISDGDITGLIEIDLANRAWHFVPFDPDPDDAALASGITSISPDGRWATKESAALEIEPYAGLQSARGAWFLVTRFVELWDLAARRKHARIATAPQPVLIANLALDAACAYADWLKARDRPRGPFGLFRRSPKRPLPGFENNPHQPRRSFLGEKIRLHWEPDSTGLWLVRRYSMRRAGLDGSTGPLIFPAHGLGAAQHAILQARQDGAESEIDMDFGDDMAHGPGCYLIRELSKPQPNRVRFDFYGAVLDLPQPYAQADAAAPLRKFPKLTAREIEAQLPAVIAVPDWTQQGVDTALDALKTKISAGLEQLTSESGSGQGLTLLFKQRGAFLDEWSFFEKLSEKGLVNVPALRDLLGTWCDALGARQWYFTSDETRAAGPMSGALACLARHDPGCHAILRRYCLTRDGEHESYARDTVLLDFIKAQGLGEIETLRLAVFFIFLRDHDGRFSVEDGKLVYPWADLGLVEAARALTSPDAFAEILRDEAAGWGRGQDEGLKNLEAMIASLRDALDPTQSWDAALLSVLSG